MKEYLIEFNFNKQYKELVTKLKNKTIIVYGGGKLFETICQNYNISELNIIGVCDRKFDDNTADEYIYGYKKIPFSKLAEYNPDCVLVAIIDNSLIIKNFQDNLFRESKTIIMPFLKRISQKEFFNGDKKFVIIGTQNAINRTFSIIENENFPAIYGVSIKNDSCCEHNGFKNYSLNKTLELYKNKEINGIILPLYEVNINSYLVIEEIEKFGFKKEDIYPVPASIFQANISKLTKERLSRAFKNANNFNELPIIKFLLSEHCNLNCAGCSHFAPLVKEKSLLSFEEFKSNIDRLKELFEEIRSIQLLGGEPLLNKELGKMIIYTKQVFPHTYLSIISNGILFPQMDDELFTILKENNVMTYITEYPNCKNIIDKVDVLLKEKNVKYLIRRPKDNSEKKFFKKYQLIENKNPEETFYSCPERICHTINNSKFSSCYYAVTVERANKYFGINIPWQDSVMDLYDKKLTAKEIINRLSHPINLCRYCSKDLQFSDWHITNKTPKLEDYFIV